MKTFKFELITPRGTLLSVRDIQAMPADVGTILRVYNFGCQKQWPGYYWRLAA